MSQVEGKDGGVTIRQEILSDKGERVRLLWTSEDPDYVVIEKETGNFWVGTVRTRIRTVYFMEFMTAFSMFGS